MQSRSSFFHAVTLHCRHVFLTNSHSLFSFHVKTMNTNLRHCIKCVSVATAAAANTDAVAAYKAMLLFSRMPMKVVQKCIEMNTRNVECQ